MKGLAKMKRRGEYFWNVLSPSVSIALCISALIVALIICGLATVYHWTFLYYRSNGWFAFIVSGFICFFLTISAMGSLAVGLKKVRQMHMPWYMEGNTVRGITGIVFVALIPLLGFSSVSNSGAISIGIFICVVLIVAAYLWASIAPTRMYEKTKSEQEKGLE
jgi:hypothetical protein